MKKLFTLLILIGGFVCTASAAKLYVCLKAETYFFPNDNARIMAHLWGATGADVEMTKEVKYGDIWYSCELNGNTSALIVRQDPSYGTSTSIDYDHVWAKTGDITALSTTEDYYGELWYNSSESTYGVAPTVNRPKSQWDGLCCRNSIDGWSGYTTNMTTTDNNTFTRTFTKEQVSGASLSSGANFYFHFKHTSNLLFDEGGNLRNDWKEIHASSDTEMGFGEFTETVSQVNNESGSSWYVIVPSYDYEKIVFTAKYYNSDGSYKWRISADAYIKVTTNDYGYCTYVNPVALTISDATAYYATDRNNGSARAHAITNPAANTPMLIMGENNTTYSFKVAISGTDYSSTNVFKAGTGSTLANMTEGKYNYILNGNTFYAANGKTVAVGKAYLQLSAAASARPLVFSDNDDTGISVVTTSDDKANTTYNLSGQRVANPSKGLYIVNGRKVII